jgi:NADPH:quinone reductase-like Zn-dependent oxidoreductase
MPAARSGGSRRGLMKAVAIDRFGSPAVLKVRHVAVPEPGPNEVLIAMHSAGVGVWDKEVRKGVWRPYGRPRFPLVMGLDGAGVVVARGNAVKNFRLGDRVWGYYHANPKGGFYAEYVAENAKHIGHVPRGIDLLHAGAGAVTSLTALQGIDDVLRVRKGETVLIFGASGAVGTLAVQFARRKRATVIATASGTDASRLVRQLGAHRVIDARNKGALADLGKLAPKGIDAALVLASGRKLEQFLDHVRPRGRVAFPYGVMPPPKKRKNVRVQSYNAKAGPREFARLKTAVEEAELKVPLTEFPLSQAAKAHQRLERGHILGRIVLRV